MVVLVVLDIIVIWNHLLFIVIDSSPLLESKYHKSRDFLLFNAGLQDLEQAPE